MIEQVVVSSKVITESHECPNRTTKGCVTEYTLHFEISFRYVKRTFQRTGTKIMKFNWQLKESPEIFINSCG